MNYNINSKLSLMIPRVFPQWVDEQTMVDIFHKQNIGKIYKVSIIRVPDEPGRDYPVYKAYLYFSVWYDNEIAYNFQQRIYGRKKQARVVYDDPWFWTVFENKTPRLSSADKRNIRDIHDAYQESYQNTMLILAITSQLEEQGHQFDAMMFQIAKINQKLYKDENAYAYDEHVSSGDYDVNDYYEENREYNYDYNNGYDYDYEENGDYEENDNDNEVPLWSAADKTATLSMQEISEASAFFAAHSTAGDSAEYVLRDE
jgi:hypothetical protein